MARAAAVHPFNIFLALLMAGLLSVAAFLLAQVNADRGLLLGLAMVVGLVVFLSTRTAIYLLIFAMLLSPEFGAGGMATSSAALGRGVTFRVDDFLLVILGISWMIKIALYKELGILKKTPLNSAMLMYIAACVISTLMGAAAGRVQPLTGTLFVVKYTQYFVLFFAVINNIEEERDLRRYWVALLITALIVGAVGLAQIPGGQRVTAPFEGDDPEPNTFGGYLAFLILICVGLGLSLTVYRERVTYLGIAFFLFIPFLFTLSRASYLGLALGLAAVLLLTRNRVLSYLTSGGILSIFLFPGLVPEVVRERVEFTWTQEYNPRQASILGQRIDTSTTARLQSFKAALEDFPKKPFLGHGVTGWRFIDSQYFRTLIETGLVGFIALLILLLRLFQLGWDRVRHFHHQPFYRGLSIGFVGGLVCLMGHAIGSNTFIIVRIMEPFWMVAALVFMAPYVAPGRSGEEEPSAVPAAG